MRVLNLTLSVPLADGASAALAAVQIEREIQSRLGESDSFVTSFHVAYPIDVVGSTPSPLGMVKEMVSELRDAGVLPKKEKWEGDEDAGA